MIPIPKEYIPRDGDIFQVGNGSKISFFKLNLTIDKNGYRFGKWPLLGDGQCGYNKTFADLIYNHDSWGFIRCIENSLGKTIYFNGSDVEQKKRVIRD